MSRQYSKPESELSRIIRHHLRDSYNAMVIETVDRQNKPAVKYYWPKDVSDIIDNAEIMTLINKAKYLREKPNASKMIDYLDTGWYETQSAGYPDLTVVLPLLNTVAFFELKSENDLTSWQQLLFIEIMSRMGFCAGFVRSVDDVDQLIANWQKAQAEKELAKNLFGERVARF